MKYLVRWKGFTVEYDWKKKVDLENTKEVVAEFDRRLNIEVSIKFEDNGLGLFYFFFLFFLPIYFLILDLGLGYSKTLYVNVIKYHTLVTHVTVMIT